MTDKITDIVLVGVGGQGIILASEIVARTVMYAGYDVKTNEVHGMAQRGGSVIAQVRYGKKVHSPLVSQESATVLAALEQIEGIRAAHYLRKDGFAVISDSKIVPVTVSSGNAQYPTDTKKRLTEIFPNLYYINAVDKALELGNIRAANVVIIGAMSVSLDLPLDAWHKAIDLAIKPRYRDMNHKAFDIGRDLCS